jgi:hypothetical protein
MAIRNLVVARIDDDVQIPIVLGKLCCLHRIPPCNGKFSVNRTANAIVISCYARGHHVPCIYEFGADSAPIPSTGTNSFATMTSINGGDQGIAPAIEAVY